MSATQYDVVGIGNAIVDVIAQQGDEFIERFDLTKGSMSLIDADRAVELYDAMNVLTETSGGSAGNTMTGVASFGGSASFIGKVADDHLGTVFAEDSAAQGVQFGVAPSAEGEPTGRSMIVVTPDAERTMNTFLGAATTLYRTDIPEDVVANAGILYCEGYIWDIDVTKDAIRHAIAISKAAGNKISFTLSDSFCVDRHFDEWHQLLDGEIDILFGNEEELLALTKASSHDEAIEAVRGRCEILCATMGENGSVIVTADETIQIPVVPVDDVVDTTGAGDQYAAGVLFGLARGMGLAESGMLGSKAAAEVIAHLGPRPEIALSELLD
ncbi:MAG: adenosine kinase [Actinomycetota bacterium]